MPFFPLYYKSCVRRRRRKANEIRDRKSGAFFSFSLSPFSFLQEGRKSKIYSRVCLSKEKKRFGYKIYPREERGRRKEESLPWRLCPSNKQRKVMRQREREAMDMAMSLLCLVCGQARHWHYCWHSRHEEMVRIVKMVAAHKRRSSTP